MSTDITTTAHAIAGELGMDHRAALDAARAYLDQCRKVDGVDHDEDDLDDETAEFIAESIRRSRADISVHPLFQVEQAAIDLATAQDRVTEIREERNRMIRAARKAGVTVTDIAQVAGMSHQAVSKIVAQS